MHTGSLSSSGDSSSTSERRQHSRQAPNSLAYVRLDETNGGILINLSEGGLAVQAAMSVIEDDLPRVRLQVPRSKSWLELNARIIWTRDSRRMVGVQFLDLADDSLGDLREWLASEKVLEAHATVTPMPPSEVEFHGSREDIRPTQHPSTTSTPVHRPREPREIDMAAVLAAREAVSAVAARASHRPVSAAAVHTRAIATSAPAVPDRQGAPSRTRYMPLLVVLSILSLAGGWEIGRGSVSQIFAAFFEPSAVSPVSAAGSLNANSTAANSPSTNFEIVDASNQSWLVPFAGPTSIAQTTPLPVIPPRPTPASHELAQPSHVFKVGSLAAPKSGARSAPGLAAAAPVLQMDSPASLPSALSDSTARINPVQPAEPALPAPTKPAASTLLPAQLIRHPSPDYPPAALLQKVEGAVKVHARIEEDGSLSHVTAVSGSSVLAPAAVEAVQKWKYRPETLDGKPIASDIDITVQFTLPQ